MHYEYEWNCVTSWLALPVDFCYSFSFFFFLVLSYYFNWHDMRSWNKKKVGSFSVQPFFSFLYHYYTYVQCASWIVDIQFPPDGKQDDRVRKMKKRRKCRVWEKMYSVWWTENSIRAKERNVCCRKQFRNWARCLWTTWRQNQRQLQMNGLTVIQLYETWNICVIWLLLLLLFNFYFHFHEIETSS